MNLLIILLCTSSASKSSYFLLLFLIIKVAGDTLGSSFCIYLKRMHEVQRLTSTSVRNIHG